ncbi:hypothetical protein ACFOHY_05170 [Rhizobium rosettiformans]|uniref:hypothetical protein n=1 Tax=Rhizobium rosettiformans TaxID=1368430 RepID=UPI0036161849
MVISNPTLPEITDGYEIQLHHSMGHDPKAAGRNRIVHAREIAETALGASVPDNDQLPVDRSRLTA